MPRRTKPIRAEIRHLKDLDDDTLLTLREVEAILYITRATVLRYSAQGKLPKIHIGAGAIRFRAGDVRKLIHPERTDLL